MYAIKRAEQQGAGSSSSSNNKKDVIDLSQSLHRTRFHHDLCPVVTPNCKVWVAELNRFILPIEKFLIHLVPVHELV